ncbi:hypothetical protein A3D68_02625 [Candidatus Adlerbacteria bacterium RIFCSPHIGHO2_02_FULL_52_17]|uniref:DUF454 domain-containing protein n=1 Tax=Candidatus Adlerbacteria bacterium RIFCSPHIGHO2_02_FULL_52_17 TaxID=1797240 RepID=A0A1F4XMD1_9BACT|nr:MAG: hypothetical protein A3D68_02625 [Candidatus Adlerbacteria bacterium RIFCSPHIGHO2_02_FULL_52_17]
MIRNTKRTVIFVLGILFLIFGVIGLVLPFLQGILFLAIGLMLLSLFSPTLREWLERHTRKYPKLHSAVLSIEQFIRRIVGEI